MLARKAAAIITKRRDVRPRCDLHPCARWVTAARLGFLTGCRFCFGTAAGFSLAPAAGFGIGCGGGTGLCGLGTLSIAAFSSNRLHLLQR
jgi:hypothetical protein